MKSILTVIGTRPEAIKLAPVLKALDSSRYFENRVCVTRQHTNLLEPLLVNLEITADYYLENYVEESSLHQSASHILRQLGILLKKLNPDLVIIQGDTTSAFIGALAAYYSCIPIAHIEAGLRTGNLYSPWPEEAHRRSIDCLSTYFFAPTIQAKNNLLAEGTPANKIWVVGNTSIDSIKLISDSLKNPRENKKRKIIVTVHRRENHGKPLEEICTALKRIAKQFHDIHILFFLHPNPAICLSVRNKLAGIRNIELINPVDHIIFAQLLNECIFIITDSGGIQEEASFMGKPLLILRDSTERPEGVEAGTARLIGTRSSDIIIACKELLENSEILKGMSKIHLSYGDGSAAKRITNILETELGEALKHG